MVHTSATSHSFLLKAANILSCKFLLVFMLIYVSDVTGLMVTWLWLHSRWWMMKGAVDSDVTDGDGVECNTVGGDRIGIILSLLMAAQLTILGKSVS